MLTINFKDKEMWNNQTDRFTTIKGGTFRFEHSLLAISKWEADWKIPFFAVLMDKNDHRYDKSTKSIIDYFGKMCIDDGFDTRLIGNEELPLFEKYIGESRTATFFSRQERQNGEQIVTSEVIYAAMAQAQIPFECDRWNISRLTTLIRVIANRSQEPKKMSRSEILSENKKLNEERKQKFHTKG